MYCVTIAKTENGQWAGFNILSDIMLEGEVIRLLESYGVTEEFQLNKGSLKIHELDWLKYRVIILVRRIN